MMPVSPPGVQESSLGIGGMESARWRSPFCAANCRVRALDRSWFLGEVVGQSHCTPGLSQARGSTLSSSNRVHYLFLYIDILLPDLLPHNRTQPVPVSTPWNRRSVAPLWSQLSGPASATSIRVAKPPCPLPHPKHTPIRCTRELGFHEPPAGAPSRPAPQRANPSGRSAQPDPPLPAFHDSLFLSILS